jgi:hypothetical protein
VVILLFYSIYVVGILIFPKRVKSRTNHCTSPSRRDANSWGLYVFSFLVLTGISFEN